MDFEIEKLRQLETININDFVLQVIEKIYLDYRFLNIDYDEFLEIIRRELSTYIPTNIDNKDKYVRNIDRRIRNVIEIKYLNQRIESMEDNQLDTFKLYLSEVSKSKILTKEEEIELFKKVKLGDEQAKSKIFNSNLRLVIAIAKRYYHPNGHLSYVDLIQEGNLGLLRAIEGFNLDKGYKFSTYATYWIKCFIVRSIKKNGRNIKLPEFILDKLLLYEKIKDELSEKLQREPTKKEMIEKMGISNQELEELIKIEKDTTSLNILIGEESDLELIELIPDDTEYLDEVIEKVNQESLKEVIKKLLNNCGLKAQEIQVLKLYFGLDGNSSNTLEQISSKLNLTRERIRQIRERAIKRIQESNYKEILAIYTDYPEEAVDLLNKDKYLKSKIIEYLEISNLVDYDKILENLFLVLREKVLITKNNSKNLPRIVNLLLDCNLTKKEIEFFLMKYGLKMNLEDISFNFGYKSIKTIEKLEFKVDEKLRINPYIEELKKYMESSLNILLDFNYEVKTLKKKR